MSIVLYSEDVKAVQGTVLVTGGAGYIGSHAAKELARAGYRVIVYDNLSRGHKWAVRWGPLEEGSLLDGPRLKDVLRRWNVNAVLHFAALAYVGESMDDPELYFRHNVSGTQGLLEAMRKVGVPHLVFSSSCAVYGVPKSQPIGEAHALTPVNPYGESKLAAERLIAREGVSHGLRWAALRYFNAAGCDPDGEIGEWHSPETHLIPSLLESALRVRGTCSLYGNDYPTKDGTCVRDYVHVTDLAGAHVRALKYLDSGGANVALNLGTGRGYSVKEILSAAESIVGQPIMVEWEARRPGDPPELVACAELAAATLGWTPTCSSLDQILDTSWRWMKLYSAQGSRFGSKVMPPVLSCASEIR